MKITLKQYGILYKIEVRDTATAEEVVEKVINLVECTKFTKEVIRDALYKAYRIRC